MRVVSVQIITRTISNELSLLADWFKANKLSLRRHFTRAMLCYSVVFAVIVCLSVRPSVCHKSMFY